MRLTALFAGAFIAMTSVVIAAEIGEDGLHKEPWFSTTFKDVGEDIQAAKDAGKRLAIIFEQRGCAYCRKMHEEVFSDPTIADFISENYMVVQYNLFGDEEVIDVDGEELSEKTAARRWRVVYTPTILFMPEEVPEDTDAGAAAVSVMPGAFGKGTTLHMFQWVKERGYEGEEHFQKYHARKLEEMQADGKTGE
ncbi:thioredoxin fold domain-containing protein [Stappia sp. GBMRC 2046]|uniref:Thioredoxin fold domain-containing protein n=1 Tax=Stappia sediminis TaxID=2692190 RepID=A0A7X3LV17_9HYPH|nr:thioredoxin family protein [Stappia sediminis]MXN65619.1 thioredoxin fold domain-containing protein [Stappia sediminis]